MTLSAITVANYFVQKALEDGDKEMTPMKVLKLTYIAHGWYLALFDEPLLSESPQAWQYGPVVPSVYKAFKAYGNSRITKEYYNGEFISDDKTTQFLNRIWEVYKKYSGWQLSTITHQPNTPWSQIWPIASYQSIPDSIIKAHYKELTIN